MTRIRKVGIFTLVMFAALNLTACRSDTAANGQQVAPQVQFKFIDGNASTVGQFAGRVLLVDFWATTCAICLAEMPDMYELSQSMSKQGLSVVTVAMPYDRPDHVLHAVKTRGIKLPVALDVQGELVKALGPVNGTPTRVLIDRQGKIVARWVGAVAPEKLRDQLIQELSRPAASTG